MQLKSRNAIYKANASFCCKFYEINRRNRLNKERNASRSVTKTGLQLFSSICTLSFANWPYLQNRNHVNTLQRNNSSRTIKTEWVDECVTVWTPIKAIREKCYRCDSTKWAQMCVFCYRFWNSLFISKVVEIFLVLFYFLKGNKRNC